MANQKTITNVFNIVLAAILLLETSQHSNASIHLKSPERYLQEFEFECGQQQSSNASRRQPTWDKCDREPTAWRWMYKDEPITARRLAVKDSSVDERLANVQYTTNSARNFYTDAFKFASGSRELDAQNEQLVAGARVDDELCGQHLRTMLAQIDQLAERLAATSAADNKQQLDFDEKFLYLAKVLDSFGRYDSGYLTGRSQSAGAYHQCLESGLLLDQVDDDDDDSANKSSRLTETRFCWARMATGASLNGALKTRTPNIEMQDQVLSSGICIPATCHTRNFKQYRNLFERLVASQFRLPGSLYSHRNLELESVFCLVDQDSPYLTSWPLSAKLFILIASGWFLLIFWASYTADARNRSRATLRLIKCLDVRGSWLEFTEQQSNNLPKTIALAQEKEEEEETTKQERAVDLSTLNLIKVIMCAYVVMGHSAMMHFFHAQNQLRALLENEIDPVSTAILIGTFSVDTFLTITGVLLAWIILRKFDKFKRLPSPLGYCKMLLGVISIRYLRLVPLYFMVFWFKKSLFARLGSGGPFWDYGFNTQTSLGACEHTESWLTPLKLNSCYLPLFKQCLTPTWSISTDFQLCLLVTPVLLLAYRFRSSAKLLLAAAWFYCCYLGYYEITAVEPAVLADIADCKSQGVSQFFNKYSILYTSPKLRFCCMVIGALAGILLYEFDKKNQLGQHYKWPRLITGPATQTALAWIVFFFITLLNTQWVQAQVAPHHKLLMYNVVGLRAAWSLANAIVFLRMPTDWKNTALMRLSSMQLWKVLAKLNLVILLVHWDLIVFFENQQIDTHNLKKWNWFLSFGGVYLFSLILGTLLHITVENPLDRLIRVYLYGEKLEQGNCKREQVTSKTRQDAELGTKVKEN